MKVLLVKLSSMGDVIHAFPAVTEALACRPDLEIDWCVDGGFAELVRLHPGIGRVHVNDIIGARPAFPRAGTGARFGRLRSELHAGAYDLVIDAQGLLRSAAIARMAGAPIAGYDRRSSREAIAALAYQHRFPVARHLHAATRMRLLVAAALDYRIDPDTPPARALSLPGEKDERSIFLLHGTTAVSKQWPTEHWIALARAATASGLTPLATWSNAAERGVAEAIFAAVPETRLLAPRPLAEIAAEVGKASLVVGVDTGLAHFADAAGVPTLMLFQASNPDLTGPRGARSEALLPPGGVPARPRRRSAQRPADPANTVPADTAIAAMLRIAATRT